MAFLKIASYWLFSSYKAARKIRSYFFYRNSSRSSPLQQYSKRLPDEGRKDCSLLFDFHGFLLRSTSLFPFFMVVAFEGGGPLRAILLLLSFPVVLLLGQNSDLGIRVMVLITFCGLRVRDMEMVARAVLPKVYLEELHSHGYEVAAAAKRRVVITSFPKVMVEGFVKEFVCESEVVAPEMEVVGGKYFTGKFAIGAGLADMPMAVRCVLGETKVDVAVVSFSNPGDQILTIPHCKEVYCSSKDEGNGISSTAKLPKQNYPKPLVFHDGRLAFLPTPAATLAVLLWLPFSLFLSILRILIGLILPYNLSLVVGASLGVQFRVRHYSNLNPNSPPKTPKNSPSKALNNGAAGVLYVCTHRTLLDPIFLSHALFRSVPAVTYSLSPLTESVSPIPTVRLIRDRRRDADTIRHLLAAGDLAVCPEGTTCREPYLLRFSPLFAELSNDIQPVAMDAEVSMFYGTTASGLKFLDPIFFFMNPRPGYLVDFLGRVPPEMTVAGGWAASDVANRIQSELADALGFECTALTRKDKYLMLAGNDGVFSSPEKKPQHY